MKRTMGLALFFLLPCAVAADFRALDYGDDCSNLEAQESLLGAVRDGNHTDETPFIIFQGEYRGRLVYISYTCPEGKFSGGSYLFERTTFQLGKQLYAELKRHLSVELGAPFFDHDS